MSAGTLDANERHLNPTLCAIVSSWEEVNSKGHEKIWESRSAPRPAVKGGSGIISICIPQEYPWKTTQWRGMRGISRLRPLCVRREQSLTFKWVRDLRRVRPSTLASDRSSHPSKSRLRRPDPQQHPTINNMTRENQCLSFIRRYPMDCTVCASLLL